LGRLQDIPHGFLQAILADLRRSGVVIAQRGQSGGWRLNKPAESISVADVIRAVDGPLVSVYGLRPEAVNYNESASVLQHVWIAGRTSLRDVFENVSVRQLADGALPKAVTSRTSDDDAWTSH
jgi:Rrf2 family protein